jgi:hypothetical protein
MTEKEILSRKRTCCICGEKFSNELNSDFQETKHHVIPKVNGGKKLTFNTVRVHRKCHLWLNKATGSGLCILPNRRMSKINLLYLSIKNLFKNNINYVWIKPNEKI